MGGGARPRPPQQGQTLSQTASVPLVTIRTPEPEAKNCALLLWALFFTAFNKNNLIYHCIKCFFTLSPSSSNPVCGFSSQTSSLQNHTCGKVLGAASPSSPRGWHCSGPSGSASPGFPSLSPKAPAVPSAAPGAPAPPLPPPQPPGSAVQVPRAQLCPLPLSPRGPFLLASV